MRGVDFFDFQEGGGLWHGGAGEGLSKGWKTRVGCNEKHTRR